MKKIALMAILLVMCNTLFSQARIGSTWEDIQNEFKNDPDVTYSEETVSNPGKGYHKFISVAMSRANVAYFFTKEKKCSMTIIVPLNQGALNFYVEHYNKSYVIISPTKWRMYTTGGYLTVELIFDEDGSYYFIWK